jgi:hypothetical protein
MAIATADPAVAYEAHKCPGLQKGTNDEGPLYDGCGCM